MKRLGNGPPGDGPEGRCKDENHSVESTILLLETKVNKIPNDIKDIPNWVCWNYYRVNGKITKVLVNPASGTRAKTNDQKTWSSFGIAAAYLKKHLGKGVAGIGFVFTENDPYCGIDLDHCLDPNTEKLDPLATSIVERIGSYTEASPSGTGVHIIVKAKNPLDGNRGSVGGVEIYDSGRYFTMTGEVVGEFNTIEEREAEIVDALSPFFSGLKPKPQQSTAFNPTESAQSRAQTQLSDDEIVRRASEVRNGEKFGKLMAGDLSLHGDNHSDADMALCTMIAFWTQDPDQIDRIFRVSALFRESKWDAMHSADGRTYGQMTIEKALEFQREKREICEITEINLGNESRQITPVLNDRAFHGIAGRFVELATRDSEADPAAVLATFLVRFGVEVESRIHLMVGDAKHPPRLFSVIVGDTAKSRKGTSARPVERLFGFSEVRHTPGPLSSGEGIIWAVRDPVPAKKGKGDDPGVDDKRLFVLDEEFAAALSCSKRDGNTLSTTLRSAWDSGNLDPLTKVQKISATGAHVGIVSHITLFELEHKMHDLEAFNGFANRILWFHVFRKGLVPLPEPMPEDKLIMLQNELKSILGVVREFERVELSPEAKDRWIEAYPALSSPQRGLVGSVISRAEPQVLRLAMIYALLDKTDQIQAEHLEAAIATWDYCEASAFSIFGDRERDPLRQKIVDALRSGSKSKTELHKEFSGHLAKNRLDFTLKTLIREGRAAEVRVKTGGAPRTVYWLRKR